MIKVVCDKCGEEKEVCNYCITIDLLHNHKPHSMTDTCGKPEITCDKSAIRFTLCQKCYKQMGFPNIYKCLRENRLVWRGEEDNNECTSEQGGTFYGEK